MKSTTYIVEITKQKNEKYLYVGRNPVAWSQPRLLASCQLRNFPRVFTEKCFAVFDQSSCAIYFTWYRPVLFFWDFLRSFLLWYDFKTVVKSRGWGTFLSLAPSASNWQAHFFLMER